MKHLLRWFILSATFAWADPASVKTITYEHLRFGDGFAFKNLPAPASNDLGTQAKWSLLSKNADRNSPGLPALHDGKVPKGVDDPSRNFFLAPDSDSGRIHVDLGKLENLSRITSYSRHFSSRAPQVYTLYGTLSEKAPTVETDLGKNGWLKIASIDSRHPNKTKFDRHGVSITGDLGRFRHLVFEIKPTEKKTPFGLTFFSEIDIVKVNGPKLKFLDVGKPPTIIRFGSKDQKYSFIVDATEAPQYEKWVRNELSPVITTWYPKIVDLLPSKNYRAPTEITLKFTNDVAKGIPAYANGSQVTMNALWFKTQLQKEAKGCVVHELVHVVQNYWLAPRLNPNPNRTPSWVTEGLADYIRWFLFEPESKGAHYSPAQIRRMKHDASYRISANFIDWVSRNHQKDIAKLINDAARSGRYESALWRTHTGKSLEELSAAWKTQ